MLYPEAFRRRYSEEMRRDFRELMLEGLQEGGAKELVRELAQAFSDLVLTALEESDTKEKELLEALDRRGKLTAAEAVLESSLSVEEAERMLSELAVRGHLDVTIEHGKLVYSSMGKHRA